VGQAFFSAVAKEHSDMPEGLPTLLGSGRLLPQLVRASDCENVIAGSP
jgi:hypothetical protein